MRNIKSAPTLMAIIIALLLVVMLVVGFSLIIGDYNNHAANYGSQQINVGSNAGYNNLDAITNMSESMAAQLQSNNTAATSVFGFVTAGVASAVSLTFGSIGMGKEIFATAGEAIPGISWAVGILGAILTIIIIFILIRMWFRTE